MSFIEENYCDWPGKVISVFVHDLKKLLDMAIPRMNNEAKDPLMLHQFVAGLLEPIMELLRASRNVEMLDAFPITIGSQSVFAVKEKSMKCTGIWELRD